MIIKILTLFFLLLMFFCNCSIASDNVSWILTVNNSDTVSWILTVSAEPFINPVFAGGIGGVVFSAVVAVVSFWNQRRSRR